MSVLILTNHVFHDYETTKLIRSFDRKNIKVHVCQFSDFDIVINHGIFHLGNLFELPKCVLVRMGAGITRFDLSIIRYFELAGVTCINSSNSINIVQDKFQSGNILSNAGISVPTTMMVKFPITDKLVATKIEFPCIIKVDIGSFGEGIYLCHTEQEYHNIIEFSQALHVDETLLVQQYLGDRPGEDLRVFVIGGEVLGAMKRTAPTGDFRANITKGGTGVAYPVSQEINDIALATAAVLGLDIAGIDLLFDKDGFKVCEANSNPGFSGFERYCDVDVADAITTFIATKI
jgi:RimK family alpha-L-glutamate ligase